MNSKLLTKKVFAATALVAACACPITSWAGTDSGIYIGGSVGQSTFENDYPGGITIDDDDSAYKVFIGYNFGLVPLVDLAVEADYRDFGNFENKNSLGRAEATTVDIYGVAGFDVGPIGFFAKAGYADADVDSVVADFNVSTSDSSATYGVGAKFQLGSLAVRAEYETFDLDDVDDLNMWSIGASITF